MEKDRGLDHKRARSISTLGDESEEDDPLKYRARRGMQVLGSEK